MNALITRQKSYNVSRLMKFLAAFTAGFLFYAGENAVAATNCRFTVAASALNFGNLDPGNPVDINVSATVTFRCGGSNNPATFTITDDDGLFETGLDANRMRNATVTTEFLPYTVTLNPAGGTVPRNTVQTLTVNGTVKGIDYQSVYMGAYTDTVTLSILP